MCLLVFHAALLAFSRYFTPLYAHQESPSRPAVAAAAAAAVAAATAAADCGCCRCRVNAEAAENCLSAFDFFDSTVGAPCVKLSDLAMGRLLDYKNVRLTPENPRDRERSLRESQRMPYKAPELLLLRQQQLQQQYGYEVDMWSVAVIFFELITTTPPFCCSSELLYLIECCRLIGTPATREQWLRILTPPSQGQEQQQQAGRAGEGEFTFLLGDEQREATEEKAATAVSPMLWLEMLPLWPIPRWQRMQQQLKLEEDALLQQICTGAASHPPIPTPLSPLPPPINTHTPEEGLQDSEATEAERILLQFGRIVGCEPLRLLQHTLTMDRTQRLSAEQALQLLQHCIETERFRSRVETVAARAAARAAATAADSAMASSSVEATCADAD
ncbi:uncharacterized protein LOC34619325 [Cyclospora cayetanensis]|uniref:Uncharacterized protein LOC34619325 n=1 Tax=Cyclospora cayetanensis TaxID=88456 RepID=A0A6P6RT63_9EIME|nr:uncharacterized protein LOC34619325 [Cyclospora cayetanensis]